MAGQVSYADATAPAIQALQEKLNKVKTVPAALAARAVGDIQALYEAMEKNTLSLDSAPKFKQAVAHIREYEKGRGALSPTVEEQVKAVISAVDNQFVALQSKKNEDRKAEAAAAEKKTAEAAEKAAAAKQKQDYIIKTVGIIGGAALALGGIHYNDPIKGFGAGAIVLGGAIAVADPDAAAEKVKNGCSKVSDFISQCFAKPAKAKK